MYPLVRFLKEAAAARRAPPLGPFETHVSHHRCWPWDLDPWMELNNGRTLTLYDLGRLPLAMRIGLIGAMRQSGWGMSVAGASVRYRRRIKAFRLFEMRSRLLGWDARFFYFDQSIWFQDDCANQVLIRSAVTDAGGIVAPARVAEVLGQSPQSPALPGWVDAWIAAEAGRPWPPAR